MANWTTCFNWVMDNEDAARQYANVPDAPGRWDTTQTPKVWVGARAISGINSSAFPAQFSKIAAMPQESRGPAVEEFYAETFWNQYLNQVESDDVAKRVLDAEVNMGPGTGVKLLQTAIGFPPASVDGAWGPNTLAACNSGNQATVVQTFIAARIQHYKSIVAKDPSKQQYLEEWVSRASK